MPLTGVQYCATLLYMEKITFINNDGYAETAEAYKITNTYVDNVGVINGMFPDKDVLVVLVKNGLEIRFHDADGLPGNRIVASKGDFVYRDSKGMPVVVFPFMLIKDAPGLIRSLWDPSREGFDTGMEFASKWINHQLGGVPKAGFEDVRNQVKDLFTGHHSQKQSPAEGTQESWLAVYEVGECWEESDWGPLEEFLGKSGGTSPLIALTVTKHNLKSIEITDYRFPGNKVTVKPNDAIIKFNGKFAVIINAVRDEHTPFVD